jgi:hypothetical protein
LGRWATLRTLESMNYTQCSYSRNTLFPGPWRRSCASSWNNSWSSKNRGIWWGNFHISTSGWCRCTRWGKRCSARQSYSVSAKFAKLPQQSSSSTIFRGRRSSSTTQARWPWKTRVPMGGTLHRDISDTRRSLSTTRQENGAKWE